MKTNIDLIDNVDVFPYGEEARKDLWTLMWEDEDGAYPIGYVLDRVFRELLRVPVSVKGEMDFNPNNRTIMLLQDLDGEAERTARIAGLSQHWRENGTFKILRGWRDELWPVYGRKGELLFSMERAAMGLLGTMRYGVHMIAYVRDESAPHGVRLWVPRRAANKSTFPGMLDNTVAGGLATGEEPRGCLVREADEEASLPADIVEARAKCVDVVTYVYVTDEEHVGEAGFIYPECQWVYDLELPPDVIPQPKDGEVQEFNLCDVDEIKEQLKNGEYKHNCGLVVLDFFIRHGILTKDTEPGIDEIQRRIHREMPFPGPHKSRQLAA